MYDIVFLCQNTFLASSYKFRKGVFNLHDVINGGIPCMGTSPGKSLCTRQAQQEHAH